MCIKSFTLSSGNHFPWVGIGIRKTNAGIGISFSPVPLVADYSGSGQLFAF
jgi:hypothetical protein